MFIFLTVKWSKVVISSLSPAIHTIKFILTCPAVNDVLYAVLRLSVSEGPADICPSAKEANESSLAVIDTG